jgi:hypothetical protein
MLRAGGAEILHVLPNVANNGGQVARNGVPRCYPFWDFCRVASNVFLHTCITFATFAVLKCFNTFFFATTAKTVLF